MRQDEASATARGVAAHRLEFERVAAPYGDPDADQRLQEDVAAGIEVPMTMMRYLRVRTRFFDQAVVDAFTLPIEQAVAVGAGYDGRALRYAKPGVRWFELDHPATQADKRVRLDALGIATDDLTLVPVDFEVDDIHEELARAGEDPTRPTLFTCEGVAGYLSLDALDGLLRVLRRSAGAGSRLVIEIPLEPDSPSEIERRAKIRSVVASLGEPLVSSVARPDLYAFVRATGWEIERSVDPLGVAILESERATAFTIAAAA